MSGPVPLRPDVPRAERPPAPPVLGALRGEPWHRPAVDPELAGGLREWLEDGVAPLAARLDAGGPPLVVHKRTISAALAGELGRRPVVSTPMALGSLVDVVFRQLVTAGSLGDPWEDGCAALAADDRQRDVLAHLETLGPDDLAQVRRDLERHASRLVSQWPPLPPAWLARTQERVAVALAGGRLVLAGVVDLALGAPSTGRASLCLVEVKAGRRRFEHRADVHFYALLETVRAGAAPCRVATYYSENGQLDAEDVTDEVLANAVRRTLDAVSLLAATLGARGRAP